MYLLLMPLTTSTAGTNQTGSGPMLSIPVDKRILLHIMEYSKYENQFEVPFAISQEGIANAIGIRRDNIPRAMKDLKVVGLVTEKVARVEGVYRKRKVYFLTEKGYKYIQELRTKIFSTMVQINHPDGKSEQVKITEINNRFRPKRPLGLIDLINIISSELKKRMQGKSCFNFKSIDKILIEELSGLTKKGYEFFKKEGLI